MKKLLLLLSLVAVVAYTAAIVAENPKACCKRKATTNVALTKISNNGKNPNCPHVKRVKEMKEKGIIRFYGEAWSKYLTGVVSFSGPTIPPGPWDDPDCICWADCTF